MAPFAVRLDGGALVRDTMMLTFADISADDPEVSELLRGLAQPTYSLAEIVGRPTGRSKLYEDIRNKRIRVSYTGTRPFVVNVDLAKYLVLLRRESAERSGANRSEMQRRGILKSKPAASPKPTPTTKSAPPTAPVRPLRRRGAAPASEPPQAA